MSGTGDYDLTPNLGLYKPVVDADLDMWGDHLNLNADILDDVVQQQIDSLAGYLPLSGGSLSGGLGFGSVYALTRDNMTRHLMLYSTTVGIAPTNGLLNYNVPATWGHLFRVGSVDIGYFDGNGLWLTAGKWMRLAQNASNNLDAVPLQQLNSSLTGYVNKSGDQMQGPFITQGGAAGSNLGIGIGNNTTGFWSAGSTLVMQCGGGTSAIYGPTATTMYLPLTMNAGTTFTLAADAAQPLQAVTLRQMQAAIASGASITVGDTPPASPSQGSLWWSSAVGEGQLYLYYTDPTSSQWVIANSGGIPEAPTDNGVYARSNSQWSNIATATAAAPNNTGRSFIHNGRFNVLQRGRGPWSTNNLMTADRWQIGVAGGPLTVQINPVAAGSGPAEDAENVLSATVTGTGNAGDHATIDQHIEDVRRLSGRTVTVSFYAQCAAGSPRLGVNLYQFNGATGSPMFVGVNGQAVTLSTAWQRFALTFTIPSAAGNTISGGDDSTYLRFWLSADSSQNVNSGGVGVQSFVLGLWGIQLEYGNVATPLARRDPADELALCQRFYSTGIYNIQTTYSANGAAMKAPMSFPVQMRNTPTMTATGIGSGVNNNPANIEVDWRGFCVIITCIQDGVNAYWNGTWTASADL